LMVRYSSPAMAEAFITSRLAGQHGHAFGTLQAGLSVDAVLEACALSLT
jgi:putative acyl-CoA dehydrogenase